MHAEGLGLPIFLLFSRSWKSPVWVWALLDVQGWAVWPLRVTACPQQPPHHMPGEDTDSARLVRISRAHWPGGASFADFLLPLLQAPLMTGQPGPGHGKKLGHRGVDASGETTYKKVPFCPLLVGGGTPSRPGAPTQGQGCSVPVSSWRQMLSGQAPPRRPLVPVRSLLPVTDITGVTGSPV